MNRYKKIAALVFLCFMVGVAYEAIVKSADFKQLYCLDYDLKR